MTRSHKLSIALAQCNFTVGDINGNCAKILDYHQQAAAQGADLVVFSEMAITGYPPEDLLLHPAFNRHAVAALEDITRATLESPCAIIVGGVWMQEDRLYNAAFLLEKGGISEIFLKHNLPNYGIFDEKRLFSSGKISKPVKFKGVKLGIAICEEMWQPDVVSALAGKGAGLLIVINASPFDRQKEQQRRQIAASHAVAHRVPLLYVNQVGGQDGVVFDGGSFGMNSDGALAVKLPWWREHLKLVQLTEENEGWHIVSGAEAETFAALPHSDGQSYQALVLGLADYVRKNGFPGVLIGLSGGMDSALSAAVAVDALGKERVRVVMLPSRYTSQESIEDAEQMAKNLGLKLETLPIELTFEAALTSLESHFAGKETDLTEENMQARIRGMLLMALSNKFGFMVLSTGNKSELAVGYATLYGDMCGGYNVLKDVYKTDVYALARWRNHHVPEGSLGSEGKVIPDNIITKAPTAELRPNQTDQDSLPPYELLDDILYKLVEEQLPPEKIIALGYARKTVEKVTRLLYLAEYKRRQSAPGVKVSTMCFNTDRRYPITNGWLPLLRL